MQIEEILSNALNKHHLNPIKRKIVNSAKSWTFACPICGDSHDKANMKRGHLYKKNFFYVCYNCDVKVPFTTFLELVKVDVDPETLYNINQQISVYKQTASNDVEEMKFFSLDRKISLKTVIDFLNRNPSYKLRNFKPIERNSIVWKYLVYERKISDLSDFHEAEYEITENVWQPVMVSLNRQSDILLGFQWRNLEKRKDKRRFKIYNWQECWEFFNNPLTDDEYKAYNKVSYIYNILNIDPEVPITVFEGFIDSLFVPNSIALVGVNTDYSFLMQDGLLIRFFFDNDKSGRKKTEELIKKGYSVFLWNKFFKAFSKMSPNPQESFFKLQESLKDLNQLAQKINNPYNTLQLENYFAKDKMDIIDL
jgi:predicted RNA-binding Zn-ribbon protein involved in translation (DUF1610 family)